jgi:HEPN domain-containing protein
MSRTGDRYQAERWLDTAREDLQAARVLAEADIFAHACFLAQQAAEKAARSLWYAAGDDPWGHSVLKLISQFPHRDRLPGLADWEQRAALLDRFYIPTRYPNGLPDLTPGQSFFATDAEQAIEMAAAFVNAVAAWLPGLADPALDTL